jgi:hypothetical protein
MVNRRQVIKSAAAVATVVAMPKYASAQSAFNGFYPAGNWVPAKQAMIQVYPRPDSETNTWARHRWAYYDGNAAHTPQYKIPLGVSFGAFPYVYQLLSGPPGMTIGATVWNTAWGTGSNPAFTDAANAGYGYLLWTPTATLGSPATVSVLVTDQQHNTLTITFTVSTSGDTSHFIFVDAVNGNDSTGTGTISAPWQTFTHATTGNATKLLYLRQGTYTVVHNSNARNINYYILNTNSQPSALMGFPGDTAPILDISSSSIATPTGGSGTDLFMQRLNPNGYDATATNAKFYWEQQPGVAGYRQTFDLITWTNSGVGTQGTDMGGVAFYFDGYDQSSNLNNYTWYQFINNYTESGRSQPGRQGNNYVGCSCYSTQYTLVQGMVFLQSGYTMDQFGYFKVNVVNSCFRGCTVNVGSGSYIWAVSYGGQISGFMYNNESCYTTAVGAGNGIDMGIDPDNYGALWCYRNSVVGSRGISTGAAGGGPIVFDNNAAQGGTLPTGSFVVTSGNIIAASGLLDSNGKLTSTYASYLGTVGAQIALASSTATPNAPVLKVG